MASFPSSKSLVIRSCNLNSSNPLRYFRINISQLSVIGAAKNGWISFIERTDKSPVCYTKPLDSLKNWNDHFFWVDEFACLVCFPWHTAKNVTRDPAPLAANLNAQDYATLVAHPSPFWKFLEEFLFLVGLSRHYTLDEDTYPSFLDKDREDMDIFAFIHTPDPTKVKIVERERAKDEPRLLAATVGRTVPLLPVAPSRDESELDANVDRLFDEGGSGAQTDQGNSSGGSGEQGVNIQHVTEVATTAAEHSSHPPKKLRDDHGTPSGASVGGKSRSSLQQLLARAIMNDDVWGEIVPTLPFVTSSVSATPEREDEGHTDSATGPNLRTISAPQRFVISSDSSHHSGVNIVEAEVDSFARPSVPVITATTTVTSTANLVVVVREKIVKSSLFSADSTSAGGTDPAMGGFTDLTGSDFLVGGIRTVVIPDSDLQKVYVPQWNVTNGSRLDDGGVCREMVDEFVPLKFFASVCNIEHDRLFAKFIIRAARQISLSAVVRMRAEYNIKERRRLKSIVEGKDALLKARDEEIGSLKAQLLLKEAEAAKAIRLRAEASKFEAVEKSFQGEVEDLKERNTTLEKEKDELDVKVVDLAASVKVREQEIADLDVVVASVKSQNDNLVHELEASSVILQEKMSVYEKCMGQLERFQDEKMKVMNDKFDKLYVDFIEMALHLEESDVCQNTHRLYPVKMIRNGAKSAGGNFLTKNTQEALTIIENKSKVQISRNKPQVSSASGSSAQDAHISSLTKQVEALLALHRLDDSTQNGVEMMNQHMKMTETRMQQMQEYNNLQLQQLKNHNTNTANKMDQMQKVLMERPQGVLPNNTVPNPREDLKAITTRSGVTLAGPSVPPPLSTSKELSPASTSTELPHTPVSSPVIHFNISFAEALAHMPKFTKMVKDLLTNKEKLLEMANTPLNENCSAVILKKLPKKLGDTGRFLIPCDFYGLESCMALADLGASINLVPLSVWRTLSLHDLSSTRMTLELATQTVAYPAGIAEDVFVQLGKFTFPADFVVVDYEVDPRVPLILGRPFLRTAHALVDVHGEKSTLRVSNEELVFNVESTSKYPRKHSDESIQKIDILDINLMSGSPTPSPDLVVESLSPSLTPFGDNILFLEELLNEDPTPNLPPIPQPVCLINETKKINSSIDDPLDLELKDLPPHLEYAFLEGTSKLPFSIAKDLKREEKEHLLKVLKSHKRVIAWKISDIRGIDLNFCTHKILMEDDFKPAVQHQRRMLERLAGNEFYCFLDGFSGYFQIPIDPQDHDKTTFTCPYGTFAYRRMPFGLCNAPETFQRCMVTIFHDMIEKTMEVFMDDFLVFGDSFSSCLSHLDMILKWCEDTNLVLSWEKCHFMVKEGIILGHKISKSGIEVYRAKLDVISKIPPPTMVKGIRSFLGHAGFYRRFIKYFSKIARPMTHLLEKDTPFFFLSECQSSFEILKKKLTEAPILQDAKPRLLWWNLLLREFTIEIHNKKGVENLAADYLSRLENPYQDDRVRMEIIDNFPHESLNMISLNPDNEPPWFADIANYLVGNVLVKGMSSQQKKKFFKDIRHYF
ncbi:reverse transcriptase domain-containing protein [Tanacetum coccineum]